MARKFKLVISDLHIGSGQASGHGNPWESFFADEKLCEFLHFHSTDFYEDEDVELIINGDLYDFLQVRIDGGFPEHVTEALAVRKLEACIAGHPKVHKALREFLAKPRKRMTILPGNHDFEWVFPKVQERFREEVGGSRTDARIRVICDRDHYEFDGIQVHHGMQFEIMHRYDFREAFIARDGDAILNLPWGSIFIIKVITKLKQQRPYVDRVHPFWAYFLRALLFDPLFALKIAALTVFYFAKTRIFTWPHLRSRLRQTFHIVREARVYPDLENKVRKVLRESPGVHTLLLGHTHVAKVRRFEDDTQYVNTGCWTSTISLDLGSFGLLSRLTYAFIEQDGNGTRPTVSLREWQGYRDVFREVHF
jgi:UDP-2,3-diacylglucosamine pyrophosphatase LpxH